MSRTLNSSDRSALIRLASTMPAGSDERRAILARIQSDGNRNVTASRFPPRSVDFNKVKDPDGFWSWPVSEAMRQGGLRLAPTQIGDLIFFLNMSADAWERSARKR